MADDAHAEEHTESTPADSGSEGEAKAAAPKSGVHGTRFIPTNGIIRPFEGVRVTEQ